MNLAPTLRRSSILFLTALAVLTFTRLLRGHAVSVAVTDAAAWAAMSTLIFAVWDWRRRRRGEYCAVCDDVPISKVGD